MKLIWLASRGRIDGSGRYENSVEVEATDNTSTAYACTSSTRHYYTVFPNLLLD